MIRRWYTDVRHPCPLPLARGIAAFALRPLAGAADAFDGTIPLGGFTLQEAWPALEKTTDREVGITPAVVSQPEAIQVMTIHAAKGLEFPVVVVVELTEGNRAFPHPDNAEDAQLLYVAATRARDLLVLAHSTTRPRQTLSAFGAALVPLPWATGGLFLPEIPVPGAASPPPLIKATDLGLYEQCRLHFAAIHEGRYLPPWTIPQSLGARVHKAWELWARAGMPQDGPIVAQCLEQGIRVGDSPQRKLPGAVVSQLGQAYSGMVAYSRSAWAKMLAVEQRYTYVHGGIGQVEGVVDAVAEGHDGAIVLIEWKTAREVAAGRRRPYELQARAGALGLRAQGSHAIERIEIIPSLDPSSAQTFSCDEPFIAESQRMFDDLFRMLQHRDYPAEPGDQCKQCPLKKQCPAWPR